MEKDEAYRILLNKKEKKNIIQKSYETLFEKAFNTNKFKGDPSHEGKLVKRSSTDVHGKKITKWVSKEEAESFNKKKSGGEEENKPKKSLTDFAKETETKDLKAYLERDKKDPKIEEAVKKELEKRKTSKTKEETDNQQTEGKENKGEGVEKKEKQAKEPKKIEWFGEISKRHNLNRLPIGVPQEQVKTDETDPLNHWVMQWRDPKTGEIRSAYTREFLQRNAEVKWKRISKITDSSVKAVKIKTDNFYDNEDKDVAQSAAIINIIANTALRPGDKTLFKKTGNRGVSTLSPDSVEIDGDKINFSFTGKSYKHNVASIKNQKLADYLLQRKFEAKKENKEFLFDVPKEKIFDTFREKLGFKGFKLKDLRTYIASSIAKDILFSMPPPPLPEKKSKIKRLISDKLKDTFNRVSKKLNNSPSMAKSSYVNPHIIDAWILQLGVNKEEILKAIEEEQTWKVPTLSEINNQIKKKENDDDTDDFSDESLDPDEYNLPENLQWIFDEKGKEENGTDINQEDKELKEENIMEKAIQQEIPKDKKGTTNIFVIRHGNTKLNAENNDSKDFVRGHLNIPLTKKGIKNAKDVAKTLKKDDLDVLFSSDLKRSKQTADIISEKVDLPVKDYTFDLRPWNLGKFQGEDFFKNKKKIIFYINHPDKPVPAKEGKEDVDSKGESFNIFKDRFLNFIKRIAKKYKGQNIGIVTHYRGVKLLEAWMAAGHKDDNSFELKAFLKHDPEKDIPGSMHIYQIKDDYKNLEEENVVEKAKKEQDMAMEHSDKLGAGTKKRKKLKGKDKIAVVMREFARGTLHSGSGEIVTDRDQALAIAYSEAKKHGFEKAIQETLTKKEKTKVIDFLKEFKGEKIPDEEVHKLAEELGIETEELESFIYSFASKEVQGEQIGDKKSEDKKLDKKQLKLGVEVEKEHKDTFQFIKDYYKETGEFPAEKIVYGKIAEDHLREISDYYDLLKLMEEMAKQRNKEIKKSFDDKIIKAEDLSEFLESNILITDLQYKILSQQGEEGMLGDIEKAKKDLSKLQKKIIINKEGKRQGVCVKPWDEEGFTLRKKLYEQRLEELIESTENAIKYYKEEIRIKEHNINTEPEELEKLRKKLHFNEVAFEGYSKAKVNFQNKRRKEDEDTKVVEAKIQPKKTIKILSSEDKQKKGDKIFDKIKSYGMAKEIEHPLGFKRGDKVKIMVDGKEVAAEFMMMREGRLGAYVKVKYGDRILTKIPEKVKPIKGEKKGTEENLKEELQKLNMKFASRSNLMYGKAYVKLTDEQKEKVRKEVKKETTIKEKKREKVGGLTEKEIIVLRKVLKSEYQDSDDESVINNPVWTSSVSGGKSDNAILGHLQRKGFVGLNQFEGEDETVHLTKKGFEYLKGKKKK